jgi:hypothetical protein
MCNGFSLIFIPRVIYNTTIIAFNLRLPDLAIGGFRRRASVEQHSLVHIVVFLVLLVI